MRYALLAATLLLPLTAAAESPRARLDAVCEAKTSGLVALAGPQRRKVAEAMAKRLSAKLRVVPASRYIGETEKNLDRLLDEAARGGVVLFFDEADALFGKRTAVKAGRDRYAELEKRVAKRPSLVVVLGGKRPFPRAIEVAGVAPPWAKLCPKKRR